MKAYIEFRLMVYELWPLFWIQIPGLGCGRGQASITFQLKPIEIGVTWRGAPFPFYSTLPYLMVKAVYSKWIKQHIGKLKMHLKNFSGYIEEQLICFINRPFY